MFVDFEFLVYLRLQELNLPPYVVLIYLVSRGLGFLDSSSGAEALPI